MSERAPYQIRRVEQNIKDAKKVHCPKYHDSKNYKRSAMDENTWYCNKCMRYFH